VLDPLNAASSDSGWSDQSIPWLDNPWTEI
jgi:hypothetical protein